ncbi:teichoic acid D-Ala incorporation-associated protein DltX [Ligilactobacillus sp. LYQ135]
MKEKLQAFWQNNIVRFIARTIFYFVILFALVYMYSYSGIDQPHFIYNEF